MHWERLINKRTRIQIRKAQSWGCRSNLQQAPSLSAVGARTCQARLPLPLSPPLQALPSSAWTQERGKAKRGRPGLPLSALARSLLAKREATRKGLESAAGHPRVLPPLRLPHQSLWPSPSGHMVMPSGFCQGQGLKAVIWALGRGEQ